MKTKKSSRIISLLLAVIMIVGMLPVSSIVAAAATTASTSTAIPADAEWKLVGTDSKKTNLERYLELRAALMNPDTSDGETAYIRLDRDIKLDINLRFRDDDFTKDKVTIPIWNNVVFDLNGHTIKAKIYYGTDVYLSPVSLTMFEIRNGGTLTIVDSKSKGKIATDSWISDPKQDLGNAGNINVFDMFRVNGGGELIINASGATFECGRSKQQWVTNAYTVDREPPGGTPSASYFFTGNLRGQACGSVVIAEEDSKVTVAGGKLLARGYNLVTKSGYYDRCAVFSVSGYNGTVINIIDGVFYGKGCADVFSIDGIPDITIRSGVFDVFKVDKVPVLNDPWGDGTYSKYVRFSNGTYGEIGIPDSALDPDNSDIIIGGHNYSEDEDKDNAADDTHKTVTVKPKTNTKTPDEQIMVESANGVLTVGRYDSSYIIKAKSNKTYFSKSDSAHLDNDLQDDTSHYYIWTFTLYDAETGKKCEAEPMQLKTQDADEVLWIDVLNFKQPNTNSFSYRFESDHIDNYKIKAEVEEVWEGQHTYRSKFFNWFKFNYYNGKIYFDRNEAADALDFTVIPKENPCSVCNWYTIHTDNEEGMEFYFEFLDAYSGYSADITCNSYYQYCTVDTAGKTVLSSKQEIATGTEYGDNIEFMIPPKHSGPVYVTVEYVLHGALLTATVTVTHQVLALDYMYYDILSSDKVTDTRYVATGKQSYQRVELSEDEEIVIKPNISADMTKMDVKDPITGKTIDKNEIKWQYSVGLDDYGKHIWNDVPDYEIVDYKVDGVKLPCVKTQRTAWYRIRYDWGGQSYYSPQYILVEGVSYEDTRVATVVRDDKFTGIYGKGTNKLYLDINKNADWYTGGCTLDKIQIFMINKPSGASANTLKTLTGVTVDKNNRIELINTDSFFENEAGAVTGNYTFRVRVIGTNADGSTYQVTTNYDVWYSQQTTDLNLYVNGTAIYEHDAINIPCILPADTNIFDFTADYYPLDSKGNGIDESSIKWTSSNRSVLRIDQSTGEATALTPGTVTVTCSWKDTDGYSHSSTAKVSVPIAGFEINEIDYSPYAGRKLSDINTSNVAEIKSVWSYGGAKVTTNTYRYMTIELTSANGWGAGSVNFKDTTIDYNNNNTYGYTIKPYVSGGYFFAVEAEADDDEIEYYVDTNLLQTNGLDNGSIMPVENYGATTEWNTPYTVQITSHSQKTYEALYADYMYIGLTHQPVIEDPDAVYLSEVNITVSEPAVGDNRYEGTTYYPMNEYLVLNVSGLLGGRKTDDSYSYVSKLDTSNMRGTGKPYDDASTEEKGALALEYMSVWNTTSDYSEWYKPTKTYENGIYVHEVGLGFDSAGDDGLKIYLAKDARIYVNGRMIDYANIYYSSYDESCVSFKYYFDVGEVETASTVKVTGIKSPLQGEIPSDVEDATVLVNGEASDSVYLSKFIWFVDANGNGTYDEGEEAQAAFKERYFGGKAYNDYDSANSTLWYDGRFLAGVEYSLYTEFSKSDDIRIDTNAAISFDFDGTVKNSIGKTSDVFTFPADYVIRTVSIDAATTDYTERMMNDPYNLSIASNFGGNIRWDYYAFNACDNPTAAVSEFVGTKLVGVGYYDAPPAGKTWLEMQFFPYEGFSVSPNVKFLVNGSDTCEEFASGRNKIEYRTVIGGVSYGTINIYYVDYMFTAPGGAGVTVSGTATSFGSDTAEVTIQLIESGMTEPAYEAVVKGKSVSYSIASVPAGTYTMKVMKQNHVTREYTVTVGSSNVTQDVKIHLLGDIDGNGTVTIMDAMRANSHARGVTLLTDYALKCADVVGTDGNVTIMDAMRINAHARGTAKLW